MKPVHEHMTVGGQDLSPRDAERKLKALLSRLRLRSSEVHNLMVAASEAINNAVMHGNKNDPSKRVYLDISYEDHNIMVEVQDEGKGFNPENLPNPLLPENLLKPSGRGIHIMKSLMDSVDFSFTPGGTKITMQLKISNKSGRD